MRIAITGSNGFLGKNFVSFCKKKNLYVDKLPSASIKNQKIFYKNENKLTYLLNKKKINTLIHFAGVRKKECEGSFVYAKKSIFTLTKIIIKAINKTKRKIRFIYISSDHVFDGYGKLYKENNFKNLFPETSLGILKLRAENYIKDNLSEWFIIRLSAVLDDNRLFKFVADSIKEKKEIKLYTNIFFSPVISIDLFKLILSTFKLKRAKKIFHCSGIKRVSKYNFYNHLFGNNSLFKKEKAKLSKFHPLDLSLSNKNTSLILNFNFTNFERSIEIIKNIINKKK